MIFVLVDKEEAWKFCLVTFFSDQAHRFVAAKRAQQCRQLLNGNGGPPQHDTLAPVQHYGKIQSFILW